jgi:DNA-binding NarL/FixJ family response regulator
MATKSEPVRSNRQRKMSVLVLDEHPVVRGGVVARVNNESGYNVCCDAGTAFEAQQAINRFKPDIMVLELALPDRHGLEFIKDVRAQSADLRILVFSAYKESVFALRALRSGANGFVTKSEPMENLLNAVRLVAEGHYAVNSQIWASFLSNPDPEVSESGDTVTFTRLSDRELEVFELIGKGAGTREIAGYLNRSVSTIETCRGQIKEKLRLVDCAALVSHAVRWVECRRGLAHSQAIENVPQGMAS